MTRRVFRAIPLASTPGGLNLTLTAPPAPAAPVVAPAQPVTPPVTGEPIVFSVPLIWTEGQSVQTPITIFGGSETFVSIEITFGSLPAEITASLIDGQIVFDGTPGPSDSGYIEITVTDSNGATATIAIEWTILPAPA